MCSGSWDQTLQLWDAEAGETIGVLTGHKDTIWSVAWSPTNQYVASASSDKTIRIWDTETEQQEYLLEGHTTNVISVAFMDDGRFLASLGELGGLIAWQTDTWAEAMRATRIGDPGVLANLAVHPTLPVIAALGSNRYEINIWDLDFALLRGTESASPTTFYVNAKAVLLGDSGVGKSGLGIRMAEGKFSPSEGSTHGAQFWHFPTKQLPALPDNIQAELTLWDLAGQPEYRLTHQLFLDDTDAALLLFDCSDPNDPFRGVPYWAKVLKKLAPTHALKFLVSARCDVSPVTVDRREINHILASNALDAYFKTSALRGDGVEALFERLLGGIPWERLPRTSTPRLFQTLRKLLLERKEAGDTLLSMGERRDALEERFTERTAEQDELDTVVALLQSRGLVFRLDPRPRVTLVLLKPQRVNQYGSSIIQAARNHKLGIGAVPERDVLTGALPFSGFERLSQADEVLVLEATTELLIRNDLGFREMGYLVFPSQINITRVPPEEAHPRTEVTYRFSGSIETIYASLVVRLSYTDYFQREDQWRYAVEFSRDGVRLGFSMEQVAEGTGELEIYFHPGINEFDRVTFIRFVTDHLRAKGIDIEEEIRLYCPNCSKEVNNREAIESRVQAGDLEIPCQYCSTVIVIPKSVEEHYRRDPSLVEKQQELAEVVERRTETEVEQLRTDQRQYTSTEDLRIRILHLSDLHLLDRAAGALVCDEELYRQRFAPFNDHFYRRVYSGQDYPTDDADQALLVERPEDRMLFLGLNSCWQLDHHFRERASIHMPALTRALDRLQDGAYDGWLKIAVWHHPVTGPEMMNNEFMQLLAVHGFRICLHGHIHEAIEGFHKYDNQRGIYIVGAGTFGAPAREQVTGIPLQYNLLTFDPAESEITVHTRKKEKPDGAWSADARWGDKNDPKPWYKIPVGAD